MVRYLINIARKLGILPQAQEEVPQFRGVYEMALDSTGKAMIPYIYQVTDRWVFHKSDFDDENSGEKYICMYPRDTFAVQFPSMAKKNAYPHRAEKRIYIPREWRDYTNRIDFVGVGDHIELWDPDAWVEYISHFISGDKEPSSVKEIMRMFNQVGRYHEVVTVLDKEWQKRASLYVERGYSQDDAEKTAVTNVILGGPYLAHLSETERTVLRRFIGGDNQDNISAVLGFLSETGEWKPNTAATYKYSALRKLQGIRNG